MDFILDEAKYYVGPCCDVELGLQAGIFQFSISCSLALKRCLLEVTAEAIAVGKMSCFNGCFTWLSGVVAGYWLPGWEMNRVVAGRQLNGKGLTPNIQGLTGHLWESSMTFNACWSFPVKMRLFPSRLRLICQLQVRRKAKQSWMKTRHSSFCPPRKRLACSTSLSIESSR